MARITVEDCLSKVDNRFGLIHLAAKRVRQLRKGAEPLVVCKNKDTVTALREIAAGQVLQVRPTTAAAVSEGSEMPFFIPLPGEAESTDSEIAASDSGPENVSDTAEDSPPDSTREEEPA